MKPIATTEGTKDILKRYPFVFKKKFGQNFLINNDVLDEIIEAADLGGNDYVLEIGPGIGCVTQALLVNAKKVIAIEIDKLLIPILEDNFGECPNLKLINNDVLKVDLHELIKEEMKDEPQGSKIKVVANLPYYITTPIIMMLLEERLPIETITVMVQKEVALRMHAEPGTKQYGAITVALNYYASSYLVTEVPRDCFMPSPNVDSAVIQLRLHEKPPVEVRDETFLFKLVKAAFSQRRKTLLNTLFSQGDLDISKDDLKEVLDGSGIGASVRGETLSLEKFAELTNIILDYKARVKK
ncbi:MAG TPA: 16S rRNA (adenine(1518)-N(6)/adenine(1519)-N(6))-dimethyltransferase RsmA [Epulopiscium sp.]|nr:16S rRNA (adenine(1518)-N(6)/adenine(1519)-N(6))-dimethyltransferase RsmA [Candidatus Epulonipiscium sp.]